MLANMGRRTLLTAVSLALIAAWSITACSAGSGFVADQRAQAFVGGALSNFGGIDGDDAGARSTARDIAIARDFDFIQGGVVIGTGTAATSRGSADPGFADGAGPIAVAADTATVTLSIASLTAGIEDVTLTGEFGMAAAQAAAEDAGLSFTVEWEIAFTDNGQPVSLTASQVLSGAYWVAI